MDTCGRPHVDQFDSPGYYTHMTVHSDLPEGYHPGRFHIFGLGICVRLDDMTCTQFLMSAIPWRITTDCSPRREGGAICNQGHHCTLSTHKNDKRGRALSTCCNADGEGISLTSRNDQHIVSNPTLQCDNAWPVLIHVQIRGHQQEHMMFPHDIRC